MISAATLICLGELLSGDPMRGGGRRIERAMPAELARAEPASWIGAASDARRREANPKSRAHELTALADHVRNLGRGIFVVTSADAIERAQSVAVDLARELGRQGVRVLFLDFHVAGARNAAPNAVPGTPGLADLLFGVANFGEVIQRDPASRVHVIPVGRGIRDTAALLAADRLAIVLGALAQTYDHVVASVPALHTVARGGRLARFARGLVLIASEGAEDAGVAASDALGAQGFANVAVATAGGETPPGDAPRAAA
jgi:Mrp family chromosome partitioning ATPase